VLTLLLGAALLTFAAGALVLFIARRGRA